MAFLKTLMEFSGMIQTELSKHTDIAQYRISQIVNGHRASKNEKEKLEKFFGMPGYLLIGGENESRGDT